MESLGRQAAGRQGSGNGVCARGTQAGLLYLPAPGCQRTRPAGPTLSTLHCVRSQDLLVIPEDR